jgi:hypothetical protein
MLLFDKLMRIAIIDLFMYTITTGVGGNPVSAAPLFSLVESPLHHEKHLPQLDFLLSDVDSLAQAGGF